MHLRLKHKIQIVKCKSIKLEHRRKSVWTKACGRIHRFNTKNMIYKMNKLDLIKTKNFWSVNNLVKGIKRHAVDWHKILANHTPDKWCISKLHKEFPKLNKMGKRLKHFTKEETEIADKHMKILFNITSHQGNANLRHNELPLYTHQNSQNKKQC